MKRIEEAESIFMYQTYGISEWKEKCLFLSDEELEKLECNTEDEEVKNIKSIIALPFPNFVYEYLNFRGYKDNDISLGYKIFILPDEMIEYFGHYFRSMITKNKKYELSNRKEHSINVVDLLFSLNFEELVKFLVNRKHKKDFSQNKVLYLTKYIDSKTAEDLHLSIAKTFKLDGVDGFELDKKIELLNPGLKSLITMYLGLEGTYPKIQPDIAKEIGYAWRVIEELLQILLPAMSKTLGDMKNRLGVVQRTDEEIASGDYIEYSNPTFKNKAIKLEVRYILNHLQSTIYGNFLSTLTRKEVEFYIAKKYMYSSSDKVRRNLGLTVKESQYEPADERKMLL